MRSYFFGPTLWALWLFCFSTLARADIGGAPILSASSAVATEAAAAHQLTATSSSLYTMRQTTLANGTTEREYLDTTGRVFAVAWNGPFVPDLPGLMGNDFYSRYMDAKQTKTSSSLHSNLINGTGVHVTMMGHQRAYAGVAYAPQLIPAGVSLDSIR